VAGGYRTKMGFEEEDFKVMIVKSAKGEIEDDTLEKAVDVRDVEMVR